jgi:hypothetical protein
MTPLPDDGELLSMAEWKQAVACGSFIPYDGDGHWVYGDRMDSESDSFQMPPPELATGVMWFNR